MYAKKRTYFSANNASKKPAKMECASAFIDNAHRLQREEMAFALSGLNAKKSNGSISASIPDKSLHSAASQHAYFAQANHIAHANLNELQVWFLSVRQRIFGREGFR